MTGADWAYWAEIRIRYEEARYLAGIHWMTNAAQESLREMYMRTPLIPIIPGKHPFLNLDTP